MAGLKITKQVKCTTVVQIPSLREALQLLGLPEKGELHITVRCDRGEIPLDDKCALVVNWTEQG